MDLCEPRGPLSRYLIEHLRRKPHPLPPGPIPSGDPLADEDANAALYICYQLHHRGFDDVNDEWEWSPSVVRLRRGLEHRFERALRARVRQPQVSEDIAADLQMLVASDDSPSLSSYLERDGSPEEFREFVVHRSIYQLQEADPHTWAIPRIGGRAKGALVMIQADEYGGGRYELMHATLFESAMRAFDLDTTYGAYIDHVPGETLATLNLMGLFGLNRRLRGALVGHLAAFELTSTGPNLRYGNALRRFGYGTEATRFYDEHVTADETHGTIACNDLARALVEQEPGLAEDVLFGAASLLYLEARFAQRLLGAWHRGATSLRRTLAVPATA